MSDNPAWKPLLDKLPPAYHDMVKPILSEWDQGVQQKFQEIQAEYEPLKPFKQFVDNNIAPDYAWQSVEFAAALQEDPASVADQINKTFDLGYVSKADFEAKVAEAAGNNDDTGELFDTGNGKIDLSKIPEFNAMKQTLETIQSSTEEERRKAEEAAQIAEFERELNELEKKVTDPNGDGTDSKPFNRMFVTALMAQGVSGDEAVKQFHTMLGMAATPETDNETPSNNTDTPVTLGNGGNVGSGTPDGNIEWGKLSDSDFQDNVVKVLQAQLGSDT